MVFNNWNVLNTGNGFKSFKFGNVCNGQNGGKDRMVRMVGVIRMNGIVRMDVMVGTVDSWKSWDGWTNWNGWVA